MATAFGPYRLLRRLAAGGMGEVYLAVLDRGGFQKPVALKTMLPTLCGNRAFLERFEREAAIAARLNHANIVQIFDHGCIDGTAYLVMELVEGPDLARLLQHHGKLPPGAVAELGLQLCRALAHAHTRKDLSGRLRPVVHGDISPSNIMVSPEGQAKLADFGIARMLDEKADAKRAFIAGKTRYMSPEQARGGELGPASDIYSLALVLVEALSGTNPVPEAADAAEALERAQRGLEAPQEVLAELCPPEWVEVLAPCLERAPARRAGSASELARRISERLQPGGPEELARLVEEASGGQAALQVSPKTLAAEKPLDTAGKRRRLLWISAALSVAVLFTAAIAVYATSGVEKMPAPETPARMAERDATAASAGQSFLPSPKHSNEPPVTPAAAAGSQKANSAMRAAVRRSKNGAKRKKKRTPTSQAMQARSAVAKSEGITPQDKHAATTSPSLSISAPSPCKAFLDGKHVDCASLSITARESHLLELAAGGFDIQARLVPVSGPSGAWMLTLRSRPWAYLELDGTPAGQTPRGRLLLRAGTHSLSLRRGNKKATIRLAVAHPDAG